MMGCSSTSRRELNAMKGELYIKEKRCKGCGICANTCPFGAITMVKDEK